MSQMQQEPPSYQGLLSRRRRRRMMMEGEEEPTAAEYCKLATWADQIDFNIIVCAVCNKSVCTCRTSDTIECAVCHRNKVRGCKCIPTVYHRPTNLSHFTSGTVRIVTLRPVRRSKKCDGCGKYWTSYEEVEMFRQPDRRPWKTGGFVVRGIKKRYFCSKCMKRKKEKEK